MRNFWKNALVAAIAVLALLWVYCLTQLNPDLNQTPEPVPDAVPAMTVQRVMEEPVAKVLPKYYEVPLDTETQDLLRAACEESGIDMELALAVIWKETDFRNIEGDGGNSLGYMQIQPRWHADRMERLGVEDLMEPDGNFRVGCDFLAELLEDHALAYALTYYNSGKAVVSPYAETVMDYMELLKEGRA